MNYDIVRAALDIAFNECPKGVAAAKAKTEPTALDYLAGYACGAALRLGLEDLSLLASRDYWIAAVKVRLALDPVKPSRFACIDLDDT